MNTMAETKLVLAIFADEASADNAVETLKAWDQTDSRITLGAIGVLVVDDKGKLKEQKMGARSGKKGAGIGLVLAIVAPPTLLAGVVGGGIAGHFHHAGLGLTADDRERLGAELTGGKAAVGVLVPATESDAITATLVDLGGTAQTHDVSDEALEAIAATAPDADASEAAPVA
jgi:uncharacterized membrane protein